MSDAAITSAITTNATGPAKVTIDGQSMEQHSIADQIAADRYLSSIAATTSKKGGINLRKIKAPGPI